MVMSEVTVPYSYILEQKGTTKKLVYATKKNEDGTVTVEYAHREYKVQPRELRRVNP
jgi:hypothetical protein